MFNENELNFQVKMIVSNCTAEVIGCENIINVFISCYVIHESIEYIITDIDDSLNHLYDIDSITLPNDS